MNPIYYSWKEQDIYFTAIYSYSPYFRSLLYLYKGCGDIVLSSVFLSRLSFFIRLRYRGYVIVYAPSHEEMVAERGFDHIPLIFKELRMPIVKAIEKIENVKQSDQNKHNRKKIIKNLRLIDGVDMSGQKILLVDDVFTTGSTMRACVKLLRKKHPAKIEVLVLAKVEKDRKKT